jgi:hypothetical protein
MLLQFERHFSIAHDSIFGGILSSPNFGGSSLFSGSGSRSSEDNSVLEIVLNVEAKRVTRVYMRY